MIAYPFVTISRSFGTQENLYWCEIFNTVRVTRTSNDPDTNQADLTRTASGLLTSLVYVVLGL